MSVLEVSQPWWVYDEPEYGVREIWRGDFLLVTSTIVSCLPDNLAGRSNQM